MATDAPQRAYKAPCPGCGAPVEFRSAQSTHAVCGYCHSTVVRQGDTLARIGKMAELFDDHSPLQLQASGTWNQQAFTLVGRLQYKYGEGTWTEWYAVLADGSSAYLSEDNGAYVFSTALPAQSDLAAADKFRIGSSMSYAGKAFSVASNNQVALTAAQGELPRLPELGQLFDVVELRSADGAVLSMDYSCAPAALTIGQSVLLEDLKISGLRDESVKDEKGREFNCPNCGAPVTVALASSKTITCGSCNSIIDLSKGIGSELQHAIQDEPVAPLIPLGTLGTLQGMQWQVVGFQHRMGTDPSDPDEQFGWEEYLLYNRQRGFVFLVDSSEGWSLVKPITGAPVLSANGQSATYLGKSYQLKESYRAETNYVLGEFYWQVTRGQQTANRDFASGASLLSQEQSTNEVTWSQGSKMESDAVAAAFKLQDKKDLLKRSDVGPGSAGSRVGCATIIVIVLVILLLLLILGRCSRCDPRVENCTSSGARSSGGSFGGFSSGGGHK